MTTITHKLALFEHIAIGFRTAVMATDHHIISSDEYIRVTPWIEVSFQLVPREETIPEVIKSMDAKIQEVRADCEAKITEIERHKAELLALPNLEVVSG